MTTLGLYSRGRSQRRRQSAAALPAQALWPLLVELGAELRFESQVPYAVARWQVNWHPVDTRGQLELGAWFPTRDEAIAAACARPIEPERVRAHALLCSRLLGVEIHPGLKHLSVCARTGLADRRCLT